MLTRPAAFNNIVALQTLAFLGGVLAIFSGYVQANDYLPSALRKLAEGDDDKLSNGDIAQLCAIPFVSGFVGWGTNIIALKMTFFPLEFFGWELYRWEEQPIGLFGWQGIIPAKAKKMAGTACDIMLKELFNVREIFNRIDKKKAAQVLKPGFKSSLNRIIDELTHEYLLDKNTSWKKTESTVKAQITSWAMDELPVFTESFMGDLVENLDECYDLKHMCVTEMVEHKELLNDLFLTVGEKELVFIERSGFAFGFLFGLLQSLIFFFFREWWILPIAGAIVGYLTNFIALKMIFNPIEEYPICGGRYTVHGLFLKRQQEASETFAVKMVENVLHSKNIWRYMLNGPKSDRFEEILRSHTEDFTDRLMGYTKPLVEVYMGAEQFKSMKEKVVKITVDEIEEIIQYMHNYTDTALDLETEIRTKMQALPSHKFERVLHPVFEEDELKLILVGAFLGIVVGFAQAAFSEYVIDG